MPYLQLDVPHRYPAELKRRLARRLGEVYAQQMQTTPDMVCVAVRELGDASIWRCTADGDPVEAAVLSCEIRAGRPADQRADLARALIKACAELLDVAADRMLVEFTQHAGDEMLVDRRWLPDWSADEAAAQAR